MKALTVTSLVAIVAALSTQPAGSALPADAVAYKCAVDTLDGETKVVYFDAPNAAPERFTDIAVADRAGMPQVTRAGIARIIECARMDVGFQDPRTEGLERGIPR